MITMRLSPNKSDIYMIELSGSEILSSIDFSVIRLEKLLLREPPIKVQICIEYPLESGEILGHEMGVSVDKLYKVWRFWTLSFYEHSFSIVVNRFIPKTYINFTYTPAPSSYNVRDFRKIVISVKNNSKVEVVVEVAIKTGFIQDIKTEILGIDKEKYAIIKYPDKFELYQLIKSAKSKDKLLEKEEEDEGKGESLIEL